MTEQEMRDRIALLEEAVRLLNELWTKEREYHNETQLRLIGLSKRMMGIEDESE